MTRIACSCDQSDLAPAREALPSREVEVPWANAVDRWETKSLAKQGPLLQLQQLQMENEAAMLAQEMLLLLALAS